MGMKRTIAPQHPEGENRLPRKGAGKINDKKQTGKPQFRISLCRGDATCSPALTKIWERAMSLAGAG